MGSIFNVLTHISFVEDGTPSSVCCHQISPENYRHCKRYTGAGCDFEAPSVVSLRSVDPIRIISISMPCEEDDVFVRNGINISLENQTQCCIYSMPTESSVNCKWLIATLLTIKSRSPCSLFASHSWSRLGLAVCPLTTKTFRSRYFIIIYSTIFVYLSNTMATWCYALSIYRNPLSRAFVRTIGPVCLTNNHHINGCCTSSTLCFVKFETDCQIQNE